MTDTCAPVLRRQEPSVAPLVSCFAARLEEPLAVPLVPRFLVHLQLRLMILFVVGLQVPLGARLLESLVALFAALLVVRS